MAKTSKKQATSSIAKKAADWLDPEIIVFSGDAGLPVGAVRQHSLSKLAGNIFGRKAEDVEAEWKKVMAQVSNLIDAKLPNLENFELDEVTFQLGFSAEGNIVFVAKAGITTTISAKFKRRPPTG